METFPLPTLNLDEAIAAQFSLVDAITRHFHGADLFEAGDFGLVPGLNKPRSTRAVEETLADFFGQPDAVLVRGAGTGAIRAGLFAAFGPGASILVHRAPPYPTTAVSFAMLNLRTIESDFNDIEAAARDYAASGAAGAFVQLSRQKPEDRYDFARLIGALRAAAPGRPVLTDDNYVVMKVPRIGCQCGADLSCFSCFKLLGPAGIACVVGRADLVRAIATTQYSGGVQVQGPEAMEALRGLVYAPVALALQARVCAEVETRLNAGEIPGVARAFVANAQSRVLIVELEAGGAPELLARAAELGAAPYPVGSESRYEIAPLFYRVSGTFLRADPGLQERMIRINPMRAGADTVISILKRAMAPSES